MPGVVKLEVPAGLVIAEYTQAGDYVEEVRITNVPSFLYKTDLAVECPDLGMLKVDVAYGGNFTRSSTARRTLPIWTGSRPPISSAGARCFGSG